MHDQVGDIERCNEHKEDDEHAGNDLLPHGIFLGEEIGGQEEQRQHAAVNKRESLGANGVVGAGEEFVKEIQEIKIGQKLPFCCGKGGFSKIERIICANDHNGGNAEREDGIERNANERFDKMASFVKRIASKFLGVRKVIEEEVDRAVNADHIADIEVTEDREREEDGVHLELAALDQLLHAEREQRQPHERIDPHGVVLLNDRIGGKRVEDRKDDNGGRLALLEGAVHVESKRSARNSNLEEEERKECLQHAILREQTNDIGERTCNIICENAEKFASERTRKGVEHAGVSIDGVAKSFEEPHVLSGKVKHQNAAVANGMESSCHVDQKHDQRGQKRAQGKVGIGFEKASSSFATIVLIEKHPFGHRTGNALKKGNLKHRGILSFLKMRVSLRCLRRGPHEWIFPA